MTNNVSATSGSRNVGWTSNPQTRPSSNSNVQWGANFQLGGNSLQSLIALLQTLLSQLLANRPTDGSKPNTPVNPNVKPTPNNVPTANGDSATTEFGSPVSLNVLANDTDKDGDTLSISSFDATSANGGTVTKDASGNLVYTPKAGFTGTDTFKYTVSDGKGGTSTATATVTVKAEPNKAPVAANDSASTPYGTAATLNVLGNDTDPNGDPLSVQSFTQPTNGTVTQGTDGKLVYTPKAGFTGTDTFTYTVSDGKGGTATGTATVSVGAKPNSAPVAGNDSVTTAYGQAVTPNLLGNDTDADGDTLSITKFSQPANGTVTQGTDGKLTYTPKPGFSGTDTFQYQVSDGKGGTATGTATVTVAGKPNAVPVAGNDAANTAYNTPVSVKVLGNDTDADGDTLSISSFDDKSANGGAVTKDASGNLVYTPKDGFSGTDTFKYTVSDGKGGTSTATATVTVAAKPNAAPVANKDSANTAYGTAVSVNPLTNDTDADGDTLSVSAFDATSANGGTVSKDASGNLVYTPKTGFSGADTFSYSVSDGKGGTATSTVTVNVAAPVKPNDSPWNPNSWSWK
jgi:hypothetical protein